MVIGAGSEVQHLTNFSPLFPSSNPEFVDGQLKTSRTHRLRSIDLDQTSKMDSHTSDGRVPKQPRTRRIKKASVLLSLLAVPVAMAQETCISLSGSRQCSAFNLSSISTDVYMTGLFPFLSGVTTVAQFDTRLAAYVPGVYANQKYAQLLGCDIASLSNTSSLYARFTTSVICNAVVQNSVTRCGLTSASSRPLCADSCSAYAESEANIVANPSLCQNPSISSTGQNTQIRADFTNCGLPGSALSTTCVNAISNEPLNCGFGDNTVGLCSYCGSGSTNSTDTCCYNSRAESRCAGVVLPTITASIELSSTTSTPSPSSSATSSPSPSSTAVPAATTGHGLSGGAIAGIVVGSVVGAALLIGLVFLILLCLRRRNGSQQGSIFNQPAPARKGTGMVYNPAQQQVAPAGYEVLPGGRIARMSALEGHSGDSPPRSGVATGAGAAGAAAGYAAGRRKVDNSSSDEYNDSPESDVRGGVLRPPPAGRRNGSLSSNSVMGGGEDPSSPHSGSGGELSSPGLLNSQQSEQLPFFKDYYSQDEIHPGDKVATLWAYQPRAADEFSLERGDMLKVIGIWDDGWATGVMTEERAEDWDADRSAQRDSGVSNGSRRASSPQASGEIKAFPLVCVCLPQHWKKTIDGDGSTETGSSGGPPRTTTV